MSTAIHKPWIRQCIYSYG